MTQAEMLAEAWEIAHRMTLLVLEAIPDDALADTPGGKGRSVGAMLAHLHNNRLAWLEVAAKNLFAELVKIDGEWLTDKSALRDGLEASGRAVAEMFRRSAETGKIKGFKRSPAAFLGYLIAHEGYHHGEIGMVLAQAGHRLPKETAYGMWEWDKL